MKADFHIHTNFSYDAVSSPEQVVNAAIKKGIDCICITDHEEIEGAIRAMKFGFDKNILVIPGIEVSSKSGDILGINVKKRIPNGLSAQETIKEIRKQGGIAVVAHPFGRFTLSFFGGREALSKVDMDAMEIFNASLVLRSGNKLARDFSRENNLAFTAGSDSHKAEFIGRGYIELNDNILSEKDLILAILGKKNRVGGKPLNWLEKLRNGSNADLRKAFQNYKFQRRDKRKKNN